jgi:citrate lyase subunit beta/citryl-CoA lyase
VDAVARHSCLSVPASDGAKIDKAVTLDADEIVVDHEDSVAAGMKAQARAARLPDLVPAARALAVRVNAVGTPWCHEDILSLAGGVR